MVLVVTPIASFTVPIAVVIRVPVIIMPVVIPMILVSRRGERDSDEGSKHDKSYQYPFHFCFDSGKPSCVRNGALPQATIRDPPEGAHGPRT
jgi:hypothetical protein